MHEDGIRHLAYRLSLEYSQLMDLATLERIKAEAYSPEPSDRVELALGLLESVEEVEADLEEVRRAWIAEAQSRLAAFRRDGGPSIDGDEVQARARALLAE
jgi:hypothetical protein